MAYKGTVKGQIIELDDPLPWADGTRVDLTVTPESAPRKNSPQAWLELVGTLSEEEADAMLLEVQKHMRRIEWEMWPRHTS
jgi:hypothetical protein